MNKPYTKNKKKAKSAEWTTSGVGLPRAVTIRLKKESQLDRIERKLDELLSRPLVWNVPALQNPVYEKAPWWMNPNVPRPTVTCNAEYKTK